MAAILSRMSTITISLPEQLRRFVSSQMRKKGFDNVSEYFRSLIRQDQSRDADERLESLLLEGLDSKDIEVSPAFWSELRADAKALAQKHSKRKRKKAA